MHKHTYTKPNRIIVQFVLFMELTRISLVSVIFLRSYGLGLYPCSNCGIRTVITQLLLNTVLWYEDIINVIYVYNIITCYQIKFIVFHIAPQILVFSGLDEFYGRHFSMSQTIQCNFCPSLPPKLLIFPVGTMFSNTSYYIITKKPLPVFLIVVYSDQSLLVTLAFHELTTFS